jgi:superfamily II DNA or RNA helicase
MSDLVKVEYFDDVHMKVTADPDIRQELRDYFRFRPLNYQFNPKFKNKIWDGYIYLYKPFEPKIYVGLLHYVKKFCEDREYAIEIDRRISQKEKVDDDYGYQLAKETNFPLSLRDYQNDYVVHCIRENRALILSPTSSGKSAIIYLIQQHYRLTQNYKTLIVVDRVGLVHQMSGDFVEYGFPEENIHKIMSGKEKNSKASVTISTWHSIVNMPKEWFSQFGLFIGDEAHNYKAKSLISIMEKLTECKYKFGFTGTISSKSQVNKLILEGLFGQIKRFVTTKELIENGTIADFNIKGIVLKHDQETIKKYKKELKELVDKEEKSKGKKASLKYQYEVDFLNSNENRNKFIRNLLWSLKDQNNLVLFDRIESHGEILKDIFKIEGRHLHFIHGGVKGEERERIRNLIENDNAFKIIIHFGDREIEVDEFEEIPLSNGKTVKAYEITESHDISNDWIKMRLQISS